MIARVHFISGVNHVSGLLHGRFGNEARHTCIHVCIQYNPLYWNSGMLLICNSLTATK